MQERGVRILELLDEWDRTDERVRDVRLALATRADYDPVHLFPQYLSETVEAEDESVYEDPESALDFAEVGYDEDAMAAYEAFEQMLSVGEESVPGEAEDGEIVDSEWV